MRVLFIGDSITDCDRDRSDPADLGSGYVAMVARRHAASAHEHHSPERSDAGGEPQSFEEREDKPALGEREPSPPSEESEFRDGSGPSGRMCAGEPVEFLNRGISGDRVRDLRRRWRLDCLDLRPDLVSILIGVNDTWRRYDSDDPTSVEDFERDYVDVLERTRHVLPATRVVLLEPFLLPVREDQHTWREDLDPKLAVVRRLADSYGATLVPLDVVLQKAAETSGAAALAADGVHPTSEGHDLIARTWLETVPL